MQNIKFRFFREKVKEMVYGFQGCQLTYVLDLWESEIHVSEPMQFTGLHDINLKEIYIGDLVYCGEYEFPYEVMINDFSQIPVIDSELGQEFLYKVNGKLKVVGNVHEGFTE